MSLYYLLLLPCISMPVASSSAFATNNWETGMHTVRVLQRYYNSLIRVWNDSNKNVLNSAKQENKNTTKTPRVNESSKMFESGGKAIINVQAQVWEVTVLTGACFVRVDERALTLIWSMTMQKQISSIIQCCWTQKHTPLAAVIDALRKLWFFN